MNIASRIPEYAMQENTAIRYKSKAYFRLTLVDSQIIFVSQVLIHE